MLQNAYLLAKIGAGTAENERKFAEILPKEGGNYPKESRPPSGARRPREEAAESAPPCGCRGARPMGYIGQN